MAKSTAAAAVMPPSTRPLNFLVGAIFIVLTAASAWLVRIEPALNDVPVDFQQRVDAARLEDGTPLKTAYTGVPGLDYVLSFLVVAFASGPLRLDDGFKLLQIHFLVNFSSVVFIWNVEACRKRNARRVIRFTMLWALAYQILGGAPIVALYYFVFVRSSGKGDYLASGREVHPCFAKAILPSVVLVYCVPTIAMYLPWANADLTQNLIAFWQAAPPLVNVSMWILSLVLGPSSSSSGRRPTPSTGADLKHLNRIYLAAFAISAAAHVGTAYVCLASADPRLSLGYVFLPSRDRWMASTTSGLHWIFQWDAWFIFASSLASCWVAVWDVQRGLGGSGLAGPVTALVVIGLGAVVVGPGAAMAAVWHWREKKMVLIEQRFRGKPKTG